MREESDKFLKRNYAEGTFDEDKLIEQAKGGDPEAYNELMRHSWSKGRLTIPRSLPPPWYNSNKPSGSKQ